MATRWLYLFCMRTRLAYWWCQFGGWLLYGLTILFFAFVFDQKISVFQYQRLALTIVIGFIFTHVLRYLFHAFKLLPPLRKRRWIELGLVVLGISVLYSLANSSIVEWLKLYNPERKFSLERRTLYNFFNDTPIILVWSSIYYIWHYIELGQNTELDKVRLESLVKELQLKTLKSHINPHFIFNALNSIRALVDENPERARTAITELSNLLRSSMQAEKLETAPLERELNIVKDYLALEHIRFEDRLRVEYDIDEDTLDQAVPPMMLQTLVENAIKHGISKQKEGGLIKVISDFRESHHELIVQNTGKLTGEINQDGFGLSSTQHRLQLLFGEKASFSITEKENSIVEAKVILPVEGVL